MPLSGKPAPTSLQVGSEAYFIYNNLPQKAIVVGTSSEVTNPNSDSSGIVNIRYFLEGYTHEFSSSEIFSMPENLIAYFSELVSSMIDIPILEH